GRADHPMLGAVVRLPHSDGLVFTSRLSLRTHPWLADHAVGGVVLLPGTALVELAVRAGDEVATGVLEELLTEAPLLVPEQGGVRLQVAVGGPDEHGARTVDVYSTREDDADTGGAEVWTRHATGRLVTEPTAQPAAFDFAAWPPPGAQRIELDGIRADLAARGHEHGPAFQGLRAAWQRGEELFAEVALPEEQRDSADRFGIHPALLAAALHPALLPATGSAEDGAWQSAGWHGLALHAAGGTALRVRIGRTAEAGTFSLTAADETGAPVLTAEAVTLRPLPSAELAALAGGAGDGGLGLLRVDWLPLPQPPLTTGGAAHRVAVSTPEQLSTLAAGPEVPQVVALDATEGQDGSTGVPALVSRVLAMVQAWLAEEALEDARLLVVTRGAVPAGGDTALTDPVGAAVWGLVRAAQAEHPERIVLLDLDAATAVGSAVLDLPLLDAVLASGEPQVAVAGGTALTVPRLVRTRQPATAEPELLPLGAADGTVLITGGIGALGALTARHLVEAHGVRHLVLAGRRGPDAEGAAELVAELAERGAEVSVVACDVTDREAVAALLTAVGAEHPLTAVVHAARVFDAGVIGELDEDRLARVFAPKLTAVRHLDQLTRELAPELRAFVLMSSASSVFLGAGTGAYAAANAYLDAVAHRRRAAGLPAVSLAWSLWAPTADAREQADPDRTGRRGGVEPLTAAEGMALFDAALTDGAALLVPARLDLRSLRTAAALGGGVPPLLRGLVRPGRQRARAGAGDGGGLAARLAGLSEPDQRALLLDLVRNQVAIVLGHTAPEQVRPETAFKEIGFDSLTSVELRNRLRSATGLPLPATLVFDYPAPLPLAGYLYDRLDPAAESATGTNPLLAELSRLEALLAGAPADDTTRAQVTTRLQSLLSAWSTATGAQTAEEERDFDNASDDELFDLIDTEFGN
ncbi:type I polyketide synthase, partial [Kitasatospora sp. NPDC048296]|uniref:type I polyketide synthase n=1 Tax=Kitasatospora sp. NPDC048296 TaxID=3364048 RepID=UPI003721D881